MTRHKIALIPGDGIGVPVTEAAIAVARAAGADLDAASFPWSCEHYLETGAMMPADGIETLRGFDAIFLGAVGWPAKVPDHVSLHGLLLGVSRTSLAWEDLDFEAAQSPQTPSRDGGPTHLTPTSLLILAAVDQPFGNLVEVFFRHVLSDHRHVSRPVGRFGFGDQLGNPFGRVFFCSHIRPHRTNEFAAERMASCTAVFIQKRLNVGRDGRVFGGLLSRFESCEQNQ